MSTSTTEKKAINKVLVANRGEIAIRIFRAVSELRIRTVAIYTYEDRYSLHRYKADEAYQIGKDEEPLRPYLDIEEIIALAKLKGVDAIHPGYGFLSENVTFARRCQEEGIIFVGPKPEVMEALGDKVRAKEVAVKAQVPVIEDSKSDLKDLATAKAEAQRIGFPIMVKAAAGGGGRGMRVVRDEAALEKAFTEARGEAAKAFGDDTIFLEKYIDDPKHIEVQIMGDKYGNLVHLFERDCSVQRRFQKVVEIAPCITLSQEAKDKLYSYALSITRSVNYSNVGTVEFLVDKDENIYFIEVNPRIQVEHTITEEITGVDIVRTQLLIAQGYRLDDPQIYIRSQEDVECNGFAIQCRITTEDPQNGFKPDYGTLIAYRSAGGFGIRLDAGSCYTGMKISPFFDSMLVKVSAWGRTLPGAASRLHRALREFRIRGVKTNIGFLQNVINNQTFRKGQARVGFIDANPDLFEIKKGFDRGTKTLRYLAEVSINGNPDVRYIDPTRKFHEPKVPEYDRYGSYPDGTKQKLTELGPEGFAAWLRKEKAIYYTDTTFRDAHQSLLATRVRSIDMLKVAEGFAKNHPNMFSMEVWGGATFDVSMRFLHEDPWRRLQDLRAAIPNILLQMLLRGSNGVGYKAYPDNLIETFIEKSWQQGIDVFRIFDSLNWLEAMKVAIKAVRERTGGLAEASICYTGDISAANPGKYNLQYYLDLARRLEDEGAHILAIKDMAGLLKPRAATQLVEGLREHLSIPIHLHTHDTSSVQSSTYLKAVEAGVDVVDLALSSVSGLTSQPNLNSFVAIMQGHEREQEADLKSLNAYSRYWETVREHYYPFESGLKAGTAEVYDHEIPGGQYSNLRPQAAALGLEEEFETVKANYQLVNDMFGDIVKVTPSSKVVGDMALFMTSNKLSPADVLERGQSLAFPDSVVGFFRGELGQPAHGFPEALQKVILKGEKPFTDRPNAYLEPVDFDAELAAFKQEFYPDTQAGPEDEQLFLEFLSFSLYPKVYRDYFIYRQQYGELAYIPTLAFFYGMKPMQEILVEIAPGKTIIIRLLYISEPNAAGMRQVTFEMNGQARSIEVRDQEAKSTLKVNRKAAADNEVGAPLQGKLAGVSVSAGDKVKEGDTLFVIEAMKMESSISAPMSGTVKEVCLGAGELVAQGDLVVVLES